ncbi:response regulator transcription factor [Egicoccus halophilus]|uniref:response regulator transcription factor n=1 Tax=Egicoccus halophilus TaxID=1670830 RepID=UPI00197A8D99|nr:response regulator [Egicoccus halophilus]
MRVLAVDDDPTILRLLQVNLEMEGHEVLLADNGRVALDTIRAQQPEVVLLDVMMPEMDGFQVCEAVRADPELTATPIVFVSARAQQADLDRGFASGADAYITKPFDPVDLVETIERLAAGRR